MCVTVLERNMHFFVKHILTQLVDKVPDEASAIFMGCQPSLKVNLVENKEDGIYLGLNKIPISENRFKCFLFFVFKGHSENFMKTLHRVFSFKPPGCW